MLSCNVAFAVRLSNEYRESTVLVLSDRIVWYCKNVVLLVEDYLYLCTNKSFTINIKN